jgi:NADPH-dependent curcumin reductase
MEQSTANKSITKQPIANQSIANQSTATQSESNSPHAERRTKTTSNPSTELTTIPNINRRVVLNSRPEGVPIAENFRIETLAIPAISSGQILLRTLYLSLDPYMRGRMNDAASYTPPIALGEVMGGATVAVVEASQHAEFTKGELVLSYNGWQNFAVSDGKGLTKLKPEVMHPSLSLGVLGMPGFTAYMGLLDIGKPVVGETVVVAAASGAVGSAVGQIAKLNGCRVVGIAGGSDKCRYVTEELGFDACIDHHAKDLPKKLAASCLHGIDIYFESVGGTVIDAVLPLLNTGARIPLCGMIANYNDSISTPALGTDRLGLFMQTLLTKRIKIQGFIIFDDYGSRFGEFFTQMNIWVKEERVKYHEDIVEGLENAPSAFIGMLDGKNFGKLIVHVSK